MNKVFFLFIFFTSQIFANDQIVDASYEENYLKASLSYQRAYEYLNRVYKEAGIELKLVNIPGTRSFNMIHQGNIKSNLIRTKSVFNQKMSMNDNLIGIDLPFSETIYLISTNEELIKKIQNFSQLKNIKLTIGYPRTLFFMNKYIGKGQGTPVTNMSQLKLLLSYNRVDLIIATDQELKSIVDHMKKEKRKFFVGPKEPLVINFVHVIHKSVGEEKIKKLRKIIEKK